MATSNRTDSTIEIQLTKGYVTVIDAVDADLSRLKWFYDTGYAKRNVPDEVRRQKRVQLHRLILSRALGRELSADEEVDHINGDPLDNRRVNLRVASHAENCRNRKHRNGSRSLYKGAAWHPATGKWQASITVDGNRHYLGLHETPELAHAAYVNAAAKYHGVFAHTGEDAV